MIDNWQQLGTCERCFKLRSSRRKVAAITKRFHDWQLILLCKITHEPIPTLEPNLCKITQFSRGTKTLSYLIRFHLERGFDGIDSLVQGLHPLWCFWKGPWCPKREKDKTQLLRLKGPVCEVLHRLEKWTMGQQKGVIFVPVIISLSHPLSMPCNELFLQYKSNVCWCW